MTESRPSDPRSTTDRRLWWIKALALLVVLALVAAGLVRALLVQSFSVPSASMEPTVHTGDSITVWRPDALRDAIDPGDVVVFDGRGSFIASSPPDPAQIALTWFGIGPKDVFYVKRVIAVGGDTLECCDARGRLLRNGEPLDETYLADPVPASDEESDTVSDSGSADGGDAPRASEQDFSVIVPEGRVWVMGDNRDDSTDSRALLGRPGGGMIPIERVVGTVIGHGSSVDRNG